MFHLASFIRCNAVKTLHSCIRNETRQWIVQATVWIVRLQCTKKKEIGKIRQLLVRLDSLVLNIQTGTWAHLFANNGAKEMRVAICDIHLPSDSWHTLAGIADMQLSFHKNTFPRYHEQSTQYNYVQHTVTSCNQSSTQPVPGHPSLAPFHIFRAYLIFVYPSDHELKHESWVLLDRKD